MILNLETNMKNNPKSFWKHVDLKSNRGLPTEMTYDGKEFHNEQNIANLFANHFSSVYTLKTLPDYNFGQKLFNDTVHDLNINKAEILSILKNLNTNSSSGPDLINPIILKHCSDELVEPLFILFNIITETGEFPTEWKKSFIVPIFKSGNKCDISNYRPISIINVLSKIFEKALFNRLSNFLYNRIIHEQHGGMPGRSTTTNLLVFREYISDAFYNNLNVHVAYLDIKKAFDTVNHQLLLSKLQHYGVTGKLLLLIKNYLLNRTQIVKCNNTFSEPIILTSGIPQGSNLASLFYLIYVNDIKNAITDCKFLLFIDDLKIYLEIKSDSDIKLFQNTLISVNEWNIKNGLEFNLKKCETLSYNKDAIISNHNYHINNESLTKVTNTKDLGVYFQFNLDFTEHINYIITKSIKKLNYIKIVTKKLYNPNILIILYNSLVKSILMYCSSVWNPRKKTLSDKLEFVQHKFLRFLSYKINKPMHFKNHNFEPILRSFNLQTLQISRYKNDLKFLHKLVNNHINCNDLINTIKYYSSITPMRSVKNIKIFNVDLKLIFYPIMKSIYHLANLNNKWIILEDLSIYEFNELLNKNIHNMLLPY